MPGSIDNIDLCIFVSYRSIFGKDCNTTFPFDIIGVHHSFGYFLILTEDTALFQKLVNQGGFAMINMGNNGNVSDIFSFLFHNLLHPT